MTTPDDHQDHGEGPEERPVPETAESRRGRYIGVGIALGVSLGLLAGLLLGLLLFDHFVFCLPIGMGVGIAIGAAVGSQRAAAAEQAEAGEGPAQPENGSTR